jgi:hypothetical protein
MAPEEERRMELACCERSGGAGSNSRTIARDIYRDRSRADFSGELNVAFASRRRE